MASYNNATIVGYVGSDPEVRILNDKKVATFRVATSYGKGDRRQTDWHTIVVWSPLAEVVESYVRKSSQVLVSGEIRYRTYTDKNGTTRQTTEIMCRHLQLLDKVNMDRSENTGVYQYAPLANPATQPAPAPAPTQAPRTESPENSLEPQPDDLPF